ncbi:MAG TPA: hypothetical protein VL588_02675 [Bdellovibrionota bacterium]|jgi:hypothetical protein|nr:hypothetical protein [Bdellovibrionota bacterium]
MYLTKNVALFGMMLTTAMATAGCDDGITATAKRIEKKLGVAVVVKADENDACLQSQLSQLYAQYKALPKAKRSELRAKVKAKYTQIVLNGTEARQVIGGEVTQLVYTIQECNNGCWDRPMGRKVIEGGLTTTGSSPATQVKADGGVLNITPGSFRDESLKRYYYTRDVNLFDQIASIQDELFITSRQNGTVWLHAEDAQVSADCGKFVDLKDVF